MKKIGQLELRKKLEDFVNKKNPKKKETKENDQNNFNNKKGFVELKRNYEKPWLSKVTVEKVAFEKVTVQQITHDNMIPEQITHDQHTLDKITYQQPNIQPITLEQTLQNDHQFISEQIKENILIFYLNSPIILKTLHKKPTIQILNFPPIDLFTAQDAIDASERGEMELSRVIFDIIGNGMINELASNRIIFLNTNGNYNHKFLKVPQSKQLEFWLSWAKVEENSGNVKIALELLEHAETVVNEDPKKLNILHYEIKAFCDRTMKSNLLQQFDEEDGDIMSPPTSLHLNTGQFSIDNSPLLGTYRSPLSCYNYGETPSPLKKDLTQVRIEEEPSKDTLKTFKFDTPLKGRRISDIANILNELNINSDKKLITKAVNLKSEVLQIPQPKINNEKSTKKKKLGVRFDGDCFNNEPGSRVTVLTPVKANRKDRMELGVDSVITPVRRSLRLYNETDYQSSKTPVEDREFSETQDQQLSTLLGEHGYAYVPNKALNSGLASRLRPPKKVSTPFYSRVNIDEEDDEDDDEDDEDDDDESDDRGNTNENNEDEENFNQESSDEENSSFNSKRTSNIFN